MPKLPFLILLFLSLLSCEPQTGDTAATEVVTTEAHDIAPEPEATPGETAPTVTATEYEATARLANDKFPDDQKVELTPKMLQGLCNHKYGCLEETIYPIGWSRNGKFAYLLVEPNEAVINMTIHLIIQDTETDEQLVKDTFEAMKQPDYREEEDLYTVNGVWDDRQEVYNQLLTDIGIGYGTTFYPLTETKADWPYSFRSSNQKQHSDLFDLEFVSKHQLLATQKNGSEKVILNHTFGKYDFALATEPLGYFRSPFEERIAVLDAYEKRGYEGPPNVLKLMIVGCELE